MPWRNIKLADSRVFPAVADFDVDAVRDPCIGPGKEFHNTMSGLFVSFDFNDQMILLSDFEEDSIRERVRIGKCRRSESFIRQVFDKHAVKTAQHPDGEIGVGNLEPALRELGVSGDAQRVFADMDVNGDGVVEFEEWRAVVEMSSSVEAWAKRVPWWQSVADAMVVADATRGEDPLRAVASLSDEQLDAVCRVVAEETAAELRLQVKQLDWSFKQMDLAKQEASGAGSKFQTFKANAGTIDNFHAGLGGRVGQLLLFC